MKDLDLLDEYSRERVRRLITEAEKTRQNIIDIITSIQALIICRGESLKHSPETYEIIRDFVNDWPNIKAKRRYLAALDKLKEENCNAKPTN